MVNGLCGLMVRCCPASLLSSIKNAPVWNSNFSENDVKRIPLGKYFGGNVVKNG